MLACVCGRFRVELAPCMGGEAGVLERQISSFTLVVDGGLHMHFHDRGQARCPAQATQSLVLTLSLCWRCLIAVRSAWGRLLPPCSSAETEPFFSAVFHQRGSVSGAPETFPVSVAASSGGRGL